MVFDVKAHIININRKDGKELKPERWYLPVAARVQWFREEHPDWTILTEPYLLDWEKGLAVCRATVMDSSGRIIATGTKTETRSGWGDFLEKAETGAIGRVLAICGYGTQFAAEIEEGERIVDSPRDAKSQPPTCADCEKAITGTVQQGKTITAEKIAAIMERTFGRPLCEDCRKAEVAKRKAEVAKQPEEEETPADGQRPTPEMLKTIGMHRQRLWPDEKDADYPTVRTWQKRYYGKRRATNLDADGAGEVRRILASMGRGQALPEFDAQEEPEAA